MRRRIFYKTIRYRETVFCDSMHREKYVEKTECRLYNIGNEYAGDDGDVFQPNGNKRC